MTDLDLERLGDVWRQQPDPAELAELQRTAESVRRRARWAQRFDTIVAVLISVIIALLALRNPQVDTLLVGGGAILLMLTGQWRQRKLRAAELRSLTGSTEDMIEQSIERVTATWKRNRLGLTLAAPGLLIGALVAFTLESSSGGELATRLAAYRGLRTLILLIAALAIAATVAQLFRQVGRSRRELERLKSLREAYRQEQERSDVE